MIKCHKDKIFIRKALLERKPRRHQLTKDGYIVVARY